MEHVFDFDASIRSNTTFWILLIYFWRNLSLVLWGCIWDSQRAAPDLKIVMYMYTRCTLLVIILWHNVWMHVCAMTIKWSLFHPFLPQCDMHMKRSRWHYLQLLILTQSYLYGTIISDANPMVIEPRKTQCLSPSQVFQFDKVCWCVMNWCHICYFWIPRNTLYWIQFDLAIMMSALLDLIG